MVKRSGDAKERRRGEERRDEAERKGREGMEAFSAAIFIYFDENVEVRFGGGNVAVRFA